MFRALGFRGLGVFNRCKDSGVWGVGGIEGLNFIQSVLESTPNRERQCIGCWLCESPTRRSHSERQCKVVQIRVLVGDAWVRTYIFQADFKAITYQSPCDAVHALVPEEWSACVNNGNPHVDAVQKLLTTYASKPTEYPFPHCMLGIRPCQ